MDFDDGDGFGDGLLLGYILGDSDSTNGKIRHVLFYIGALAALGYGAVLLYQHGKYPDEPFSWWPKDYAAEYQEHYQKACSKFADTNSDGIVSPEELTSLDRVIVDGRAILKVNKDGDTWPYFSSGQRVPFSTITKWVDEYNPRSKE